MRISVSIAAVAILATASGLTAEDWAQLQHNPGHTGYTADQPNPPFKLKWQVDLQEPTHPSHQPIAAGGKVFLGTAWGNVYAYERETGEQVWVHTSPAPVIASLAYSDDLVYVHSLDHTCRALRSSDGGEVWTFRTGAGLWAAPVVADSKVFVAGRDGFVYAVDPEDGREIWRAAIPSLVMCTPAWAGGRLYVAVGDMRVYALESDAGRRSWVSPQLHGMGFRDYWVVAANDRIVLSAQTVNNAHAVSHAIQSQVIDPVRASQVGRAVLDESPVFPKLAEWFTEYPASRTTFVLDAATGEECFVPPIIGVHGGGCTPPQPAVGPDGWAYYPYSNITLGASGQTFLGRLNLRTGQMDPLLKGRFATPPAAGYWVRQPAPGVAYDRSSDWSGGFGVSDHSWGMSLGGGWLYSVREAGWTPDPKISLNMFHLPSGRDTRISNGLDDRALFRKGKYNGMFHATCSPVVISGKDAFYKSIRNVLYAFEGQ